MGLIGQIFSFLFGDGRNVVKDTAEVFRVNAEAADARATTTQGNAMAQFAAEFSAPKSGLFDRAIDGLNRLPRPAMALGAIALFVSAMTHPVWFSERMQGIALVPEPLWWLLGVVVSFYFGARHQAKGQEFQRSIAATMARTPQVVRNIADLRRLNAASPQGKIPHSDGMGPMDQVREGENPALDAWRAGQAGGTATK